MSESAQRRSEARARRKKQAQPSEDGGSEGMQQALRTAAAAAAAGAAVGAARALASRGADTDSDIDEHDEAGPDEQPEADALHEQDDRVQQQTAAVAPQSQPKERRPRHGAPTETVRSIVDRAREQLRELQGSDAESVTSLERIGDGWRVTFEVLEVERIPSSTDVLATYLVELDDDAQLLSLERVRRYARAQADRGDDR
jgi:hypothetical protein